MEGSLVLSSCTEESRLLCHFAIVIVCIMLVNLSWWCLVLANEAGKTAPYRTGDVLLRGQLYYHGHDHNRVYPRYQHQHC